MTILSKMIKYLESISKRKLSFLIIIYLLFSLFVWHLGMDIYNGEFDPILRKAGSAKLMASNLVEYNFFTRDGITPSGYNAPLYVGILAFFMKYFGSSYGWALVSFQIILALIMGLLIFQITQKVFKSRIAGIIAIILYSLHAELAFGFVFAQRENGLFAFFLLLFVYILMQDKLSTKKVVLASLLTGLAALTRPTGVILFGVMGLWIFYYSWRNKVKFFSMVFKFIVPVTIVFLLVVSPWLVYQTKALGVLQLSTSTVSGSNLLYGNNPITARVYPMVDMGGIGEAFFSMAEKKGLNQYDELGTERYFKELAVDYIKENPKQFVKLAFFKLFAFYSPLSTPLGHGDIVKENGKITVENFSLGAINVVYLPFMLILYLGIFIVFWYNVNSNTNFTKVTFLLLLVITLLHMVFIAESRHRYPFDTLLIIISAGGYYFYSKRNMLFS
jgi:4-amino-4-deoxy-L-arabinose transferase-like glycosyltransferase